MIPVSLRLPDDIVMRLHDLSAKTGRSKTYYMIEAIQEHLSDLEDMYLAEERLLAYRKGDMDSVGLSTLMERYGLDS